ncbi:hypothetical protein [Pseudomonas sp. P1.8]|uniref:hypothetical protein n=1 Tax=Pseudomonas sp. P1.8 TaxID=1699310 RepID=UPI00069EF9D2|nr:hypothetical protein [Pseudomonas sp. P1.8]
MTTNPQGRLPGSVSLRLRYRTPLLAMLGAPTFIGGEAGLAFTLNDRVPRYRLGEDHPGASYLQPRDKP